MFFKNSNNPFTPLSNRLTTSQIYAKLREYYENNGLYENVEAFGYYQDKWIEPLKGLRTCVNRSVEFYVSKILQGAKVSTEDKKVKEAIERVWKWSNFYAQKQLAIRDLALYGDIFFKVIGTSEKVYFEVISPEYVTDYDTDSRGNVVEIRIDIPVEIEEEKLARFKTERTELYKLNTKR